jgi:hypothetical protein
VLAKFVYWTGAFDFVVGAATWGGALYEPKPGQFVSLMTLGMFLMMAAACLMWASKDMENRYPVMFWQESPGNIRWWPLMALSVWCTLSAR